MRNNNMNTQMFLIITSPDPHGTPLTLTGSQKSDTRGLGSMIVIGQLISQTEGPNNRGPYKTPTQTRAQRHSPRF